MVERKYQEDKWSAEDGLAVRRWECQATPVGNCRGKNPLVRLESVLSEAGMVKNLSASLLVILSALTTQSAERSAISTFAGTGVKGFSGDGGPAAEAQLNSPTGIGRWQNGALYICDTGNHPPYRQKRH